MQLLRSNFIWILICTLILALIYAIIWALNWYRTDELSGIGSLFSAAASFLAAILFSAGLWYQATQIKEQRKHFLSEFRHLQNTSHRDALLFCKTILDKAEQEAIKKSNGLASSCSEIAANLLKPKSLQSLKVIVESLNPQEVLSEVDSWNDVEIPATILVAGIKSAATIYLQSMDSPEIDYSIAPEEFVCLYGAHFWKQPFFESYEAPGSMLSNILYNLKPGREAAIVAFFAAQIKAGVPTDILNMRLIYDMITALEQGKHLVPAIAKDLQSTS